MSSLAATQADGYYIPPEYIESGAYKKQSLSKFNGSKGHNQYLLRSVVRFELPFDGFCTKCNAIVGKGKRFNAHKEHVDNYFTSKIYEFTTKCRSCADCEFKIRTNPKEQTFDYVSGIRKKIEEFDSAEAGTHGVIDTDIGSGIYEYKNGKLNYSSDQNTVLHLLENNAHGHRKAITEHEQMESLLKLNSVMGEDADINAKIRASYRKDRNAKKQRYANAKSMGLGRGIELSEETMEDTSRATLAIGLQKLKVYKESALRLEKSKFHSLRSAKLFSFEKQKNRKQQKTIRRVEMTTTDEIVEEKKHSDEVEIIHGSKRKSLLCQRTSNNGTKMKVMNVLPLESANSTLLALADYSSGSGEG